MILLVLEQELPLQDDEADPCTRHSAHTTQEVEMKTHAILILVTSAAIFAGCSESPTRIAETNISGVSLVGESNDRGERVRVVDYFDAISQDEIDGLIFMREEEKLARDVYLTFADLYSLNVFGNIASSEQRHTDAVLVLLERYGIEDPVVDDTRGVFQNADLQALYDALIADGSLSQVDALFVGCAIEEIDILDLVEYMGDTDRADLLAVYSQLLAGSGNHLRSFVGLWEQQTREVYVPRFMSQADYDAIIDASGNGNGNGNGGNGGGNGGGTGGNVNGDGGRGSR